MLLNNQTGEITILISVCIATCNRTELLKKLLISLSNQNLDKNIEVEVIITDNDQERTAYPVIESLKGTFPYTIKYFNQPQRNISLTRNVCVANSAGDFICFIDDDETADKDWIQNLINCIREFNADAVFGYVDPVFDVSIPEKFKFREFYFTPVASTGSLANFYYTTNCIVKSNLIKSEETPFDPSYGLTGGEDAHLFDRLASKGTLFISSSSAITYEFIPKNRGTYKYLFNRALRGGQAYMRRRLEQRKYLTFKLISIIKITLEFLYGIFLFTLSPFSKNKSVQATLKIGDALGKSRAVLFKFKELY